MRRHGIALDHAGTLAAARLADSGQHDAVLLDRRLPDGDGLELLVRLRARQEGVPVIVMTAVGELADKVGGLNAARTIIWSSPSRSMNCWHACAPCCVVPC